MFSNFFAERFDIRTVPQFTIEAILGLNDVSALFYVNREYLRSEEERTKFDEFVAL